jgi:hypothetical protein
VLIVFEGGVSEERVMEDRKEGVKMGGLLDI